MRQHRGVCQAPCAVLPLLSTMLLSSCASTMPLCFLRMVSSDPRLRGDDMSTPDRRPKITLTEVASAAGVSLPTASKALNSHPGVALETRHRVQVAVDQLGYVPRRSLNRAAPRIVEVMVDQLTTNYAMEVLRGATLAAEEVGVSIA